MFVSSLRSRPSARILGPAISGVKEVSRLISRLRHRQFGIFVTTSCVGTQAYKEVVEDGHPVLFLCGVDIIEILREHGRWTVAALDEWLAQVAPV